MSAPALTVEDVAKRFGGNAAVDGVSLTLAPGEMLGLIGPNGSGKTTLLNLVGGYAAPDRGRVLLDEADITRLSPDRRARLGLARSFQVTKVFRRLTLLDNLAVPGHAFGSSRRRIRERAMEILASLELADLAGTRADRLSGGQSKLLEFGRMMMLDPRAIMLDEPFGGVHPDLKRFMHERLTAWRGEGRSILLISHDMNSVFGLCPRVVVMAAGRTIADGAPEAVRADEAVIDAYLGDRA